MIIEILHYWRSQMYHKTCNHCQEKSYSSSGKGTWQCPYCQNDMTFQRAIANSEQPAYIIRYILSKLQKELNLKT